MSSNSPNKLRSIVSISIFVVLALTVSYLSLNLILALIHQWT
ncbi:MULTISPECIES: hypothetical protein [Desertifilum]|uniref:Uncharacterized protein n=1 Tax=Desertifilum tharense IPPAS B-1220 TaxID=1781255 RepID=A0ACD5GW43_9CYAN|nr:MULTISPECIES: hypothetical protein [Desertifilum]MDA0209905.1 hypothetical protein [Cyanobacteria bacterium FC1]MDI9635472.1 hypothetical protein [Geitlerinema splendidum]